MPQFPWIQNASIGVKRIDEEHSLLLKLLGNVSAAMRAEDRLKAAKEASLFKEAISAHFAHEEGLMRQTAYPQTEDHIRQHDAVHQDAVRLVVAVEGSAATEVILAATNEIAAAFHNCLLQTDIHLVRYLEQMQVQSDLTD